MSVLVFARIVAALVEMAERMRQQAVKDRPKRGRPAAKK